MFTIAYFFEKVNLFLHDFAGIFGDYCKVVFYQCYTYAESVAKQSFVGADDSVRPDDGDGISDRADRVVGPYNRPSTTQCVIARRGAIRALPVADTAR